MLVFSSSLLQVDVLPKDKDLSLRKNNQKTY